MDIREEVIKAKKQNTHNFMQKYPQFEELDEQ